MLKNLLTKYRIYSDLFRIKTKDGVYTGDLSQIHMKYAAISMSHRTVALDLGSGPKPRNLFQATEFYGIDNSDLASSNILKCNLGKEPLPFAAESCDFVTAYDLLEHISRETGETGISSFVYLMNEVYRVLKPGGMFASLTPIYPFIGAFQDPTHVNILTQNTFRDYFSIDRHEISKFYGIKTSYEIKFEAIRGQKLLSLMMKPKS